MFYCQLPLLGFFAFFALTSILPTFPYGLVSNKGVQTFRRSLRSFATVDDAVPQYFLNFMKSDSEWKSQMANNFTALTNTVTVISKKIESNEPLWQKAGSIYELMARNEIRRTRSEDFADPLLIQDLRVLSEACLPKHYDFSKRKASSATSESARSQLAQRTLSLAKVAWNNIPTLQKWREEAHLNISSGTISSEKKKSLRRKLGFLDSRLDEYLKLPRSKDRRLSFLSDSRLGFFSYSNVLLQDSSEGFIEELEFDVQGSTDCNGNTISMNVGEIKSGTGDLSKALVQILKRVGVMYMAGLHSMSPEARDRYEYSVLGVVYTPFNWENPEECIIDRCKIEAGIKQYPNNILFRVERIS